MAGVAVANASQPADADAGICNTRLLLHSAQRCVALEEMLVKRYVSAVRVCSVVLATIRSAD